MDRLFQEGRPSFLSFIHLFYKHLYRLVCHDISLLPDRADRDDRLP